MDPQAIYKLYSKQWLYIYIICNLYFYFIMDFNKRGGEDRLESSKTPFPSPTIAPTPTPTPSPIGDEL